MNEWHSEISGTPYMSGALERYSISDIKRLIRQEPELSPRTHDVDGKPYKTTEDWFNRHNRFE